MKDEEIGGASLNKDKQPKLITYITVSKTTSLAVHMVKALTILNEN